MRVKEPSRGNSLSVYSFLVNDSNIMSESSSSISLPHSRVRVRVRFRIRVRVRVRIT